MRRPHPRTLRTLCIHAMVLVFALIVTAPAASAATTPYGPKYYLPEKPLEGDDGYVFLAIGRLGFNKDTGKSGSGNTLPAPTTSAKLVYNAKPNNVVVYDGAYCEDSPIDNHHEDIPCPTNPATADPKQDTRYTFQAFDNETGLPQGTPLTVMASVMASSPTGLPKGSDYYTVDLSGLTASAPSTDGKYFVLMTAEWEYKNPSTCTPNSNPPTCQSGTNAFLVTMSSTTAGIITYPATDTNAPALAVLGDSRDPYPSSTISFEFAPKCNSTALNRPLVWEDADVGQSNQKDKFNIHWDLYDDTSGTSVKIQSMPSSGLGGQGERKSKPIAWEVNHKYRWVWSGVDDNNGLNVFLPFDGYEYTRSCTPPPPPPGSPPPAPPPAQTKPYFRVTGGDTSVGQGMSLGGVSCAMSPNANAGIASWNQGAAGSYAGAGTQYAAFVLKHLQEFSTAQGGAIRPSGLAFANDSTAGISLATGQYGGNFSGNNCINDYFAGATVATTQAGNRPISALNGFPSGGNVPNNSKTTIYVEGDLLINSNIRFSGSYNSVEDIPSFKVVVHGNIFIDKSVSQLDGIYIAQPTTSTATNGNIYTCGLDTTPPYTAPTLNSQLSTNCGTVLTVNGAVSARQLYLLRTGGDVKTTPAEIFNYLPELWAGTKPAITALDGSKYNAITGLPPVL